MAVYVTGDTHGIHKGLWLWANRMGLNVDDTIIILGDTGLNYYLNYKDNNEKKAIQKNMPCKLFVVRGNHEYMPERVLGIPYYDRDVDRIVTKKAHNEEYFGNIVLVEDKYPKIKYAKDGYIYNIEGYKTMVIGGAYSIDKWYRLRNNWMWTEHEQLTEEEMETIFTTFAENKVDVLLTHTAPSIFEPCFEHIFMPGFDQNEIDKTMERWMDKFYWREYNDIKLHYFGHFHANINCDGPGVMLSEAVVPFGERAPTVYTDENDRR